MSRFRWIALGIVVILAATAAVAIAMNDDPAPELVQVPCGGTPAFESTQGRHKCFEFQGALTPRRGDALVCNSDADERMALSSVASP